MTQYLHILANQSPFEMGEDENDRTVYSMNFRAQAVETVTQFEDEIKQLIIDAGLGVFGSDLFVGRRATFPPGAGPYTLVINTGGTEPIDTHNGTRRANLSCQITVRARNSATAYTRAWAIWRALEGKRNLAVVAA